MAKLVDAPSSGGGVRKDVLVRIQFWALIMCPGLERRDSRHNYKKHHSLKGVSRL